MRSIIPPTELQFDLGDGEKTYKLRRTNFSDTVLLGIMGSPEMAPAAKALAVATSEAKEDEPGDEDTVGLEAFSRLRFDHQARLIAAQLYALLQYDHPELEYRDVLASIPPDLEAIGRIGRKCMEAWDRGAPPKSPKVDVGDDAEGEADADPTKGRNGGKGRRGRKPSQSSN